MKTAASRSLVPLNRRFTGQVSVDFIDAAGTQRTGRIPFSDFGDIGEPPDLSAYVKTVNGQGPDEAGNVVVSPGGGAQSTFWLGVTEDFSPPDPSGSFPGAEPAGSISLPAGLYQAFAVIKPSIPGQEIYAAIVGASSGLLILLDGTMLDADSSAFSGFSVSSAVINGGAPLTGPSLTGTPAVVQNDAEQVVTLTVQRSSPEVGPGGLAAGSGVLFIRLGDLPA